MWERSIYWFPLAHAPNGDWTLNPGMCPDRELNWWPFTLWDCAQLTGAHQSGLETFLVATIGSVCWILLSGVEVRDSSQTSYCARYYKEALSPQHQLWGPAGEGLSVECPQVLVWAAPPGSGQLQTIPFIRISHDICAPFKKTWKFRGIFIVRLWKKDWMLTCPQHPQASLNVSMNYAKTNEQTVC